jgi:rubrerythrin
MEGFTQFGANRTGIQTSPKLTKELLEATKETQPSSQGDATALADMRRTYIRESEPLGTVPAPTNRKAARSAMQEAPLAQPQVLIDRIAERLAFERTGTRLYEALMVKYEAFADQVPQVSAQRLAQFHDEEAEHFRMLAEALQTLGADPTAQTPGADLVGIQGMGLMQAITEPRTNFAQALSTILIAELADNDGWQALIGLAQQAGLEELAQRFTRALEQEDDHLEQVRAWVVELATAELDAQGRSPAAKGNA